MKICYFCFSKSKLTDEMLDRKKQVEFWNITNEPGRKIENEKIVFIDNPEVPPLE